MTNNNVEVSATIDLQSVRILAYLGEHRRNGTVVLRYAHTPSNAYPVYAHEGFCSQKKVLGCGTFSTMTA